MSPATEVSWMLFPLALIGGLFPLRHRDRDDHFMLVTTTAVAIAIDGPGALVPVAIAVVSASLILIVAGAASRVDRPASIAARRLDVARLAVTSTALLLAFAVGHLVYSRVLDATYPVRPRDFAGAAAGIVYGVLSTTVSLSVRVIAYRTFWGGFRQRDPESFDSLVAPYFSPYVACAAVLSSSIALYRPEQPWMAAVAVTWVIPIHLLARYDIQQRSAAEQLRQRALVRERLAAIGEVSARVLHQSRHQVGLMGWSTHRLRGLLDHPDPIDRRAVEAELAALDAARASLTETLANELTAPTDSPRLVERPTDPPMQADPESARCVGELVADTIRELTPKAEQLGVSLGVVSNGPSPDSPRADDATGGRRRLPIALHDALFNLVDNALDAAHQTVSVQVSSDEDAGVRIDITDDGPGLAVSEQEALEPFVTTKSTGTGMGLAIADAIVSECGGHLHHVRSSAHTTFTIVLPRPTSHFHP